MGRTLPSARGRWQQERQRLREFRRSLRREDQKRLDRLFEQAGYHRQAWQQAPDIEPFNLLLLSMLLEQQRQLEELQTAWPAAPDQQLGS